MNNENGVNHFGYTGAFNHNRLHLETTGIDYQLYSDRRIKVIHQSCAVHTQGVLKRQTNKIRYTSEELKILNTTTTPGKNKRLDPRVVLMIRSLNINKKVQRGIKRQKRLKSIINGQKKKT